MKKVFFLLASAAASLVMAQQQSDPASSFFALSDAVIMLAIAATAVGCGLAQAKAIRAALEGIARQPEAAGKISGPLLIGLGFIESLAIYVLVIALILIFANPATTHFLK
jgi:F-type H+-transporting ATPase subunit c